MGSKVKPIAINTDPSIYYRVKLYNGDIIYCPVVNFSTGFDNVTTTVAPGSVYELSTAPYNTTPYATEPSQYIDTSSEVYCFPYKSYYTAGVYYARYGCRNKAYSVSEAFAYTQDGTALNSTQYPVGMFPVFIGTANISNLALVSDASWMDGTESYSRPSTLKGLHKDITASTLSGATPAISNIFSGASIMESFPGASSESEGGDGGFDNSTDRIPVSNFDALNILDNKFIRLYSLSNAQMTKLFSLTTISGAIGVESLPYIQFLAISPFAPPSTDIVANEQITIFNTVADSLLKGDRVTSNTGTFYLGCIEVSKYWGSFLDFSPYTNITLYAPFVGDVKLDADIVMGKWVNAWYVVDYYTGSAILQIAVADDSDLTNNTVMYNIPASVYYQMPMTAANYTEIIKIIAQSTFDVGMTFATGGATAGSLLNDTLNLIAAKPTIESSGRQSVNDGYLASPYAYIKITRPNGKYPENYADEFGYPSNITCTLNDLTGYTEVSKIVLSGITATKPELDMINDLLTSGVIINSH